MKKTVLVLTIFASTTAIAYADKSDSGQVYFGVQHGYSKQTLVDGTSQQNSFGISENGYTLTGSGQQIGFYIGHENRNDGSLRYDFSLLFRSHIIDSIELSATNTRNINVRVGLMATTIYCDFYNSSSITPYISYSGIALLNSVSIKDSDSTPSIISSAQSAWGVGLGFSYNISTNWRANIGATYIRDGEYFLPNLGISDDKIKPGRNFWRKVEIIDVMAGLRYKF